MLLQLSYSDDGFVAILVHSLRNDIILALLQALCHSLTLPLNLSLVHGLKKCFVIMN